MVECVCVCTVYTNDSNCCWFEVLCLHYNPICWSFVYFNDLSYKCYMRRILVKKKQFSLRMKKYVVKRDFTDGKCVQRNNVERSLDDLIELTPRQLWSLFLYKERVYRL